MIKYKELGIKLYLKSQKVKKHQQSIIKSHAHRSNVIKGRGVNKRSSSKVIDVSYSIIPYTTPKRFSLVENFEESMLVFEKLQQNATKKRIKHWINMKSTEQMTMEVLLYLISLTNIWKKKKYKFKIQIDAPQNDELRILLETSGLKKYFRGNGTGNIEERNIYPMCDGGQETIDPEEKISQNDRCIEIREYADRMLNEDGNNLNKGDLNKKLFTLLNTLAEMMRNTDDHAYLHANSNFVPLRNWYFFAVKVDEGVSFYFIDNGEGIINTAKPKLRDYTVYMGNQNAEINLLNEVLNGDFRSRTKQPYRGKGLPEIKEFFDSQDVIKSTIITNNIIFIKEGTKELFEKKKKSFNGTLYAWILK